MPKITDIKIGGGTKEVYIGNKPIKKAYVGNDLVWHKPGDLVVIPCAHSDHQTSYLHTQESALAPSQTKNFFVKMNCGDILSENISSLVDETEPPVVNPLVVQNISNIDISREVQSSAAVKEGQQYSDSQFEWTITRTYQRDRDLWERDEQELRREDLLYSQISVIWDGTVVYQSEPYHIDQEQRILERVLGSDGRTYFRGDFVKRTTQTDTNYQFGSREIEYNTVSHYKVDRHSISFDPCSIECGFSARHYSSLEKTKIFFWWKSSQNPAVLGDNNPLIADDSVGEYNEKVVLEVSNSPGIKVRAKQDGGAVQGPTNSTLDWTYQGFKHINISSIESITDQTHGRTYKEITTKKTSPTVTSNNKYTFELFKDNLDSLGSYDIDVSMSAETKDWDEPPPPPSLNYYIDITGLPSKILMTSESEYDVVLTPRYVNGTTITTTPDGWTAPHLITVGSDKNYYIKPENVSTMYDVKLNTSVPQIKIKLNTKAFLNFKNNESQKIVIYDTDMVKRGEFDFSLVYVENVEPLKYSIYTENSTINGLKYSVDCGLFPTGPKVFDHPDYVSKHSIEYSHPDIWVNPLSTLKLDDDEDEKVLNLNLVSNAFDVLRSAHYDKTLNQYISNITFKDSKGTIKGGATATIQKPEEEPVEYFIRIYGMPSIVDSDSSSGIRITLSPRRKSAPDQEDLSILDDVGSIHKIKFYDIGGTNTSESPYTLPFSREFNLDLKKKRSFDVLLNEDNITEDLRQRLEVLDSDGTHRGSKDFQIKYQEPEIEEPTLPNYNIVFNSMPSIVTYSDLNDIDGKTLYLRYTVQDPSVLNHSQYNPLHNYVIFPDFFEETALGSKNISGDGAFEFTFDAGKVRRYIDQLPVPSNDGYNIQLGVSGFDGTSFSSRGSKEVTLKINYPAEEPPSPPGSNPRPPGWRQPTFDPTDHK